MVNANTEIKPVVILGAGGHAKVVIETLLATGRKISGLLTPNQAQGEKLYDFPILGSDELLNSRQFVESHHFIIGTGLHSLMAKMAILLDKKGAQQISLIHPSATVSNYAVIGDGTIVVAGAIIQAGARIGRFCLLNTNCSIDHDSILGDGCQICPGATIVGDVCLGRSVFVGAGATISRGLSIGNWSQIGAGAAVVSSFPPHSKIVGVPGRLIGQSFVDEQ